jgi:hypothetical protein
LYARLTQAGVDAWLDEQKLLQGQRMRPRNNPKEQSPSSRSD